ncbi:MAG: adenylyltransferase/cytidyltransferase family protein [Candidatus Parcubacteria bacterium]|nr:adenylyltransferase/cytidyltransferase family protein [Candidatus Parcubacteria bacterium]
MGNKLIKSKNKKPTVVVVSGGFDPIHIGHVRMIRAAKKLGDKLIILINNDHWLKKKKGYFFMPEKQRKEIIEAMAGVDKVLLTNHPKNPKDMSVCRELRKIKPQIYVNGGDRTLDNIPEVPVCREIGCRMVFNVGKGGKVQSSSWILANFLKTTPCWCGSGKKYKRCHGK